MASSKQVHIYISLGPSVLATTGHWSKICDDLAIIHVGHHFPLLYFSLIYIQVHLGFEMIFFKKRIYFGSGF